MPGFVADLTAGRGPLGFLQDDYQIVDKVEEAIEDQGAGGVLGVTNAGLAIARGVVSFVVGVVTIAFLTIFMLLEGPKLVERFEGSLPETMKPRWHRVSRDIYRTVGGYVGGNLLISLIAGIGAAIVLLAVGSSYAIALAVVVAILDLIPLAGATLAAIIVSTVTLIELGWVKALIVIVFFVLYQQLENHVLQPVIYGRTVQLSPLTVLIAILIGAELARHPGRPGGDPGGGDRPGDLPGGRPLAAGVDRGARGRGGSARRVGRLSPGVSAVEARPCAERPVRKGRYGAAPCASIVARCEVVYTGRLTASCPSRRGC